MIVPPILCKEFIGRRDELAYLEERRREAGRSRGGTIFIKGEAGVGKSRLIAEFSRTLLQTRWRVSVGRCLEFAQRPYGPILEVLARFDRSLIELAPAASKREQFDAILARFSAAATSSAVVVIFEDVHWADAATLEFLTYLATKVDTMRLLVIASLRPEETHDQHPLYGHFAKLLRTPRAGSIALAPLNAAELRLFIDDAVGDLDVPADVRRHVARTGDGNPFFTEELLKSAIEGTSARALPTTLHAAIMERLRPLDDAERRVLRQAAVIGRTFDVGTLVATVDGGDRVIEPALRHARALQLVEEDAGSVFRFRHALTREAIYQELLAIERRPMHRRIAGVLEDGEPERRNVESLAYHWSAAGDDARAARYYEIAGDAAGAVHAHGDAILSYTRAAGAHAARSAARGAVLEKIAQRHRIVGDTQAAADAAAEAADAFEAVGDGEREASCRAQQAIFWYSLGRAHPTKPLDEMLERLEPEDYRTRGRVHLGIAWITASFYDPVAADYHLDLVDPRALDEAPELRLRMHNVRAWTAMTNGDRDRFRIELAAWVDAARGVQQPGAVAAAHYNGGFCCAALGLHEEARRHADDALAAASAERNVHGEAAARSTGAFAALLRGDLAAAHAAVEPNLLRETGDQVSVAHGAAWGSLTGAYLDDQTLIAHWFDRLESRVDAMTITLCGAGYAEILIRRGRRSDAAALLARRLTAVGDLARGIFLTLLAVGRYGRDDDVPRARRALAASASLPHEMPERHVLPLFDAYVAQRAGDATGAARHAAIAADGLARLGLPLLAAAARELAGDSAGALALYKACGAAYDVRRLDRSAAAPANDGERARDVLSVRERDIAVLVAQGHSNVEIGHALSISHKTVEKHLGSAYRKLGFATRAQLSAYVTQR